MAGQDTVDKPTRDYCTLFPDYVKGKYIGSLCKRHDLRYSYNTRLKRRHADYQLYKDVKRQGLVKTAYLMWAGTRVFGIFWYRPYHTVVKDFLSKLAFWKP